MAKKNHGAGPVPPANRPNAGPAFTPAADEADAPDENAGDPFQDQDAKRRLGGFTGAGEHARQQPGPLNDGGQQSRQDRNPRAG